MRDRYWGFATWNMANSRMRKRVIVIMISIAISFTSMGGWIMLQAEVGRGTGIGKWTNQITARTLAKLMSDNLPYLKESLQTTDKETTVSKLILELATNINMQDPRTFIGKELPFFALFDTEIDLASADVDYTQVPIESVPPVELEDQILQDIQEYEKKEQDKETAQKSLTKKVFIYHSHFSEAYLPELESDQANQASHGTKNITLVGKQLKQVLANMGVGSVVSDEEYPYRKAYTYSRKTVQAAMNQHKHLTYFIDIHRDSQRRTVTTKDYHGKSYARIAFVVGKASAHYEKNLQLARFFHKEINQLYPGLSRGVFIKQRTNGTNGEYNQSLSPNSMLVEMGGIDNSFEEVYRTVDVLAKVLTERIQSSTPNTQSN